MNRPFSIREQPQWSGHGMIWETSLVQASNAAWVDLSRVEVYLNSFTDADAAKLRAALDRLDRRATALFVSGPGEQVYDFYQGPETIGIVPRRRRAALEPARIAQARGAWWWNEAPWRPD